MQRESRLGRALWLVLLALICGYVFADFVRSPFSTPSGAAAVRPTAVTIWAPSSESGDESSPVLGIAARSLEARGHTASVRSARGGARAALISFFAHRHSARGEMMAITSTTLADLAHDRRETLVPGVAEEATLALALLRRSRPIGVLAEAPLKLAVEADSRVRTGPELVASMVSAPEEQIFGIDDDIYSRDQLAALVRGAGVDGEVHFSTFGSTAEAGQAVRSGSVRTILGGRPALAPAIRAGDLHGIGWPLPGPRPYTWVALIAPPDIDGGELSRLRTWVARLQTERRWRHALSAEGRRPGVPGVHRLARLLHHTAPAARLERLAEQVESG